MEGEGFSRDRDHPTMDFTDSPEEADYRAKARAWLAENAPKFARAGKGSDELGGGE